MNTTTIGIVLPYLKSRGTEKQALRLASGFVQRGARVVLFVVQVWGIAQMYRAFEHAGIEVVNVGPPLDEGLKTVDFGRMWSLARWVRKYGCTALLSRAGMTNRIAGYAGRLAGVPVAVVLSSSVDGAAAKPHGFRSLKSGIGRARGLGFPWRIIAVSKEGAEIFVRRYPLLANRVRAIQNGVEAPKLCNNPFAQTLGSKRFYFCYSGSLEIQRKGLDTIIEALRVLVHERNAITACLVIIGSGGDEEQIRTLVNDSDLEQNVEFAGEQENPLDIVAQCDVFVLPSRREGLPNALLEAMSIGLCAISTDCPTGPREIITDGVDGLLVPMEDPPRMADAMERVMNDHVLRKALGEKAEVMVREKFLYDTMVNDYFELLTSGR